MDGFVKKLRSLNISLGMGETSRVTGATSTQIRYWEKKGIIKSMRYGNGTNKRYTLKNIAAIIFIKDKMDQGYTLAKAEEDLQDYMHDSDDIHLFMSQRMKSFEKEGDVTAIGFGQIENDPEFDMVAKIADGNVKLYKEEHKES
ncbi:MerR family transcriptional regulator [Lentilactobacillus sp. Marseille-Q4993]|uniref:MerR family transcriptional regulator n=1 Tax=Lentilactobacillus sp. Marseille-Q4993 TaxID=3039492 RepID=UPI0024BD3CFF|nr:MerR family transcriptional regulator [Lentilactobacillus sp. Marseille-Q4993]